MDSKFPNKILVVDGDQSTAKRLSEPFGKAGAVIVGAADLSSALYRYNSEFYQVALIDHSFRDLDVLSLIQKWRQHPSEQKRSAFFLVMVGDQIAKESISLIEELGNIEVVRKPLNPTALLSMIARSFQSHQKLENIRVTKAEIVDKYVNRQRYDDALKATLLQRANLGQEFFGLAADIYEKAGKIQDALNLVAKIPPTAMPPIKVMNLKARLLLKAGRMEEARTTFEEADKLAPNQLERINQMADMYLKMRMPAEAVARYKQLVAANPDDPNCKFSFFEKLDAAGFADHADAFCRETTGPSEVVKYYNNRGVVLAKEEKFGEAIGLYEMALRVFPRNRDNYRIYYNKALAQIKLKTPESRLLAHEALKKTLELNPDFEKARETLGKMKMAS